MRLAEGRNDLWHFESEDAVAIGQCRAMASLIALWTSPDSVESHSLFFLAGLERCFEH